MIAMFALTQTPLGRMANAVRDNPERVRFVGYNPVRVRYLMFCLASFFAGIAGALGTINYEIITAENVGVVASGSVLIMAFIGGVGHYFGPIIGAGLVSFLQSALSTYTKAWLLYFGLFFMAMIMFAPGGLASLITVHGPPLRHRLLLRLVPSYALSGAALAMLLAGFIALVEMTYHVESGAEFGSEFTLFGLPLDVGTAQPWMVAAAGTVIGLALFLATLRFVRRAWAQVNVALQAEESKT
jgi:branched-chain amino acid transport system permease protein